MTRPRLLVLTEYYDPEPNFITAAVAQHMASDFDVTVVTAYPNYPHGRFYAGVKSWIPRRTLEGGVSVWHVPLIPYHGNSLLRRGLMYLSFAFCAFVVSPFVAGRVDVVWAYQTPFTTALASLWFKAVYGARVFFTVPDLWPESLLATDIAREGLLVRVLFAYRRWINRQADVVIASTRGTARAFEADGISPGRLHYVPVWTNGIALESVAAEEPTHSVVYAGNLGRAQALETLVRGAVLLRDSHPYLTFDLYGAGSAELELRELAASLGARNVFFHGKVPPDRAFEVSQNALAQVVSLQQSPLFDMTLPSKLAFCLAAGSPVLAGLRGEAADIASEAGGAIIFDSADPASFAASVQEAIRLSASRRREMAAGMRSYYQSCFSKENLLRRYRTILTSPPESSKVSPSAWQALR